MIKGQVYSSESICRSSAGMLSWSKCFLFSEPFSSESLSLLLEFIMMNTTLQLCTLPIVMYFLCAKTYLGHDIELGKEFCLYFDITLSAILIIGCSVHQIMTAIICLPSAVVFGSHFIFNLGVQLTGFFGCLAIAVTLGVMFPIQKSLGYSEPILANESRKDC